MKDVESIALKPFRDAFANYLGGIFSRLNGTINGTGSGKTAGGAGTSTLGPLGGIFGGIFGPNSPGGTPGYFPGSIGLNGRVSTTGPAGQFGVATQTMYVTANVVNLSGPVGAGSGNGVSLPGASNFFGFGGNSFFGNNNPFGGFGSGSSGGGGGVFSGIGGLLGKAAPFLASAVLLGSGIGGGNGASISLGASGLANAGVGALAGAGKISSNTASTLGGIFGGAGLLGAGLAEGGGAGVISDVAGGAAIGTAILPGIGTAIGAAAGAIAGGIRAIFGSKTWAQQVQNAMRNQAFNAPPSETFSFASNGSIASTLSTGFAQSGNTFSQFGLPANTPFFANPIVGPLNKYQIKLLQSEEAGLNPNQPFLGFPGTNPFVGQGPLGYKTKSGPNISVNLNLPGLMDPTMASAVFTQHAQTIAQLVGRQVLQSSSGMARNIRSAVALP